VWAAFSPRPVVPNQILIALFPKLKLYGFGGAGSRFPEFLKIWENDGAMGLVGSPPRCGSLGPGRHASAAPISAW
jgi:hypothetical protein